MPLPDSLTFETRDIQYPNFAGNARPFNVEGDRNFCLKLSVEEAGVLARDGWNVKYGKKEDPSDEDRPYLPVALSTKIRPSKVVLLTRRGRTTLEEDMYKFVDWLRIDWVDLTIRPYSWTKGSNHGVKAYLQTIYVRIQEDELDMKYEELPEVSFMGQEALEAGDPNTIDYDGPVYESSRMELEAF